MDILRIVIILGETNHTENINVPEPPSQETEDNAEPSYFSKYSPERQPQTVPQPGLSPLSQPTPAPLQPGPSCLSQLGASNSSQAVFSTSQQHTRPHTKPIRDYL
ncbi:unnamed protein product [Parnassius apollo]|uniref:(apollo) hypothetical protein n=1 Tax=Parnassius apollo TaxID=110799 RepID=A0A8S3WW80_PARAO|nr:unnamed protein product [Parnassius apollo]